MFDVNLIEQTWQVVVDSCVKMSAGEKITMDEVKACQTFLGEMNKVYQFMNDNLPKQIWGRSFRKEGTGYVEDPNGEYVSYRGMFGATWYRLKNYVAPAPGSKHITPFS